MNSHLDSLYHLHYSFTLPHTKSCSRRSSFSQPRRFLSLSFHTSSTSTGGNSFSSRGNAGLWVKKSSWHRGNCAWKLKKDEKQQATFINGNTSQEEKKHTSLLEQNFDVFAWTYFEMPGPSQCIITMPSQEKKHTSLLKQNLNVFAWRYFKMLGLQCLAWNWTWKTSRGTSLEVHPDLSDKVEFEADKLLNASFIREVQYSIWWIIIVLVQN